MSRCDNDVTDLGPLGKTHPIGFDVEPSLLRTSTRTTGKSSEPHNKQNSLLSLCRPAVPSMIVSLLVECPV